MKSSKKSFPFRKPFVTPRTWAMTLGVMAVFYFFSNQVWASNQQYGILLDYSSVPVLINDRKITLNSVNVGTGYSSVTATASSGISITNITYDSTSGMASFNVSGPVSGINSVSVTVTAIGSGSVGSCGATVANLFNNYTWANSNGFADGDQSVWDYAMTILNNGSYTHSDGTNWKVTVSCVGAAVGNFPETVTTCSITGTGCPGVTILGSIWPSGPGGWNMDWSEYQTLRNSYGWDIYNETWDHACPLACDNSVTEDANNQNGFTGTGAPNGGASGVFYPGIHSEFPTYNAYQQIYPCGVSTVLTCGTFPPSFILCGYLLTGNSYNTVTPPFPSASQALGLACNGGGGETSAQLQALVDETYAAASPTNPTWNVTLFHGVYAGSQDISSSGGYYTNQTILTAYWNYLQSTYGTGGSGSKKNSMWFAPSGEVTDYIFTRNKISISCFSVGTPTFTATGTLPTNTFTPTNTLSPTATATPCGILVYDGTTPHALANVWSLAQESTVTETTGAAYSAGGDTDGLNWAIAVPAATYYSSLSVNWSEFNNTNTVNLANYTTVQFYIDNTTAADSPMTFIINLDDYQGSGYPSYSTQSSPATVTVTGTGWQAVDIPTSSFMTGGSSYTSTSIGEIDINFQPGAAAVTDTVYIDNIGFNSGCSTTTTFTPTTTPTHTGTNTTTVTASNTATNTATFTSTNTIISTATNTATATGTNTATNTATVTGTNTGTNTATETATVTPTNTITNTATVTDTPTSTNTATNTATVTLTNTLTNTATVTDTQSPTNTPTITDTNTVTNTATDTATVTSTDTVTNTATVTDTQTSTNTATITDTYTVTNTVTDTATVTDTNTVTDTATVTDTYTVTPTFTNTGTAANTNTATNTATITDTQTATNTPTVTSTNTFTNTPTNTYTHTYTPTFTATASYTYTFTPTFTYTHTTTPTFTFTLTNTPTMTATNTPTISPKVVINQGFPNPSSGSPISFNVSVPSQTTVTLEVFTTALRKIRSLTTHAYGLQTLQWDLKDRAGIPAANGLYYVRVQVAGAQSSTKIMKILILR